MLFGCLFIPLAAAYLDSERVDIGIPQVGTDVIVNCDGDKIQARLDIAENETKI